MGFSGSHSFGMLIPVGLGCAPVCLLTILALMLFMHKKLLRNLRK